MAESAKKLLIAEEDSALRETLTELFGGLGFRVFAAEDGEHAVDIACAEPVDFSLMDLHMPRLGGFDAYGRITENYRRRIPCLFMTAHREPGLSFRALSLGACGLMRKPLSMPSLLANFHRLTRRMLISR